MLNMNLGNRHAQHSFAQVPQVHMARSMFDLSHTVKDTQDFDYLNPIMVQEVIPGDTFNVSVNAFIRLNTQVRPVMDNMYYDFFFFFVPMRLVWTNWEKMCGAQDNPGDSTSYVAPILTPGAAFSVGTIFDKYGLPTDVANVAVTNTLSLRAYAKIYNDWFRDQNLQNSITLNTGNGPDAQSDFALQKRGKRHDYFTSALPWPQKGTAVSMPIGTSAPVYGTGKALGLNDGTSNFGLATNSSGATFPFTGSYNANIGAASSGSTPGLSKTLGVVVSPGVSGLYADLTAATAATINQLRLAFMTQSVLELDARGGTRYVEILWSHFKVISPDFRLQRAEYLGGGEIKISSNPVAQTAPVSGSNYPGSLSAFGTAVAAGNHIGFNKSFVEHGYVIGIGSARADLTYQQGLPRMFNKSTRFDFFWPKFQELGEQTVLNKEIYCNPAGGQDDGVFGYQERYAEYRNKLSEIRGKFRSTYATPLDMWHLAEKFTSLPALNASFIVNNTPMSRVLAVTTEPALLCDFWFNFKAARPMMVYSTPATLGRF